MPNLSYAPLAAIALVVTWASPSSALHVGSGSPATCADTTDAAVRDSVAAILERHAIVRVTTGDGRLIPVPRGEDRVPEGQGSRRVENLTFDLAAVTRIEHRDRDLAWGAQMGLLGGLFSGLITVGLGEMFDMFDQYDPGEELPRTVGLHVSVGTALGLLGEALFPRWKTVYRRDRDAVPRR